MNLVTVGMQDDNTYITATFGFTDQKQATALVELLSSCKVQGNVSICVSFHVKRDPVWNEVQEGPL